jgi:hypothetical protein
MDLLVQFFFGKHGRLLGTSFSKKNMSEPSAKCPLQAVGLTLAATLATSVSMWLGSVNVMVWTVVARLS